MKIFLGTDFSDDRLKFTAQIGADGVSGAPEPGPGDDGFYSVETLRKHRELVESYGLEWAAVRMAPLEWTYRWMLGLPGAEEQIENFKKTIRNMADVGLVFIIFNMHAQDLPDIGPGTGAGGCEIDQLRYFSCHGQSANGTPEQRV